eukprot:CAMPEP_0201112692 /NCGR_PEP_ID=MMETSP0812-20130820/77402_1 /ASSEMBLY_ACC=CAM_ASM_000668 /TAXON_ID=98059 /ORGANISM="Dinobryon sp., Strain UTEXLB2267" /LENGTH=133 /DNA_ID=CAMNT_0047376085 /DNA_START=1195 /DNA_END=1593 /DNA_ORIENTATION=-
MLTSSPKSHRLKVLLQIMYLRTYHNAGTAEVLLDGQRVAVLDALHPNFVQFFYIIEEQLTLHLEVQQVPSQKTLSGGGKDLPNFVQFFYIIEEQLTLHLEVQQVPSQVEILWRFDKYSSLPDGGVCVTEDTEW